MATMEGTVKFVRTIYNESFEEGEDLLSTCTRFVAMGVSVTEKVSAEMKSVESAS